MCRASLHTCPFLTRGDPDHARGCYIGMDGVLLSSAQDLLTGVLSGCRSCFKDDAGRAWTQQTTSCYWFPDTWTAFDKQLTSKGKIAHTCQRDLHWGIYWNSLTRPHILRVLLFLKKQHNALSGCLWLWTIVQLFTTRTPTQSRVLHCENWPAVASVNTLQSSLSLVDQSLNWSYCKISPPQREYWTT